MNGKKMREAADIQYELGLAYYALPSGDQQTNLERAIACFDIALSIYTRQATPAEWARTQDSKGRALLDLAESLGGTERMEILRAALACFDAALTVYTREGTPIDWAMTQHNKGSVLFNLARLLGGIEGREVLRVALACYDASLSVYTREEAPAEWARTQDSKGRALLDLAESREDTERMEILRAALACFDAALTVYAREEIPNRWAMIQNNKGATLFDLAELYGDTERMEILRAALACFDAALTVYTREGTPIDWAMTQHNKGSALFSLARLLRGRGQHESLQAAVACFDAALTVYTYDIAPANWAATQNNRGAALQDLAGLLEREERADVLRTAIAAYDKALAMHSREVSLSDWAMTQHNKGIALNALASSLEDAERLETLQAAIYSYDNALLEYSREEVPAAWAATQYNKGNAWENLASLLEGTEREVVLREAITCYDNALTVYTREVAPTDHYRIARHIGILLFEKGEWVHAAQYFSTALGTLDDLFTLEVTSRRKQMTLVASSDLAGYLAYTHVRTNGANAAWRAAQLLEYSRTLVTGEAARRQEAQLAAVEQLAPDLLKALREASDRLAAIVLIGIGNTDEAVVGTVDSLGIISAAQVATEASTILRRASISALNARLISYEGIRQLRASYDEVIERIREMMPDFLRRDGVIDLGTKELVSEERLAYIASTSAGAVAILIGGPSAETGTSIAVGLWDERLTNKQVAHLLGDFTKEDREQQNEESPGLLTAQNNMGDLRKALSVTMQTLGMPEGILAHLATYCRTAGVRHLILVPCGLLGLLPLHAALVPTASNGAESEPLLDVVQVSYAPSASIWLACRRRANAYPVEEPDALVVGDPQPQKLEVHPLPGAREEARVVGKIITQEVHGQESAFEGEAATRSAVLAALKAQGPTLTHVHFACHGIAEFADPQSSGLLLARGSRLMTRDLLDPTVAHFNRLRLVVLSACHTALPETELPDEVVGLSPGWLQAGAMGVITSLWPVSDSMTTALMQKFYELHLHDRLEPTKALWLAQRWLRGLPTWRTDFSAAGAVQAAKGPEASEVVRELAQAHGEKALLETLEGTSEVEMEEEVMDVATSGVSGGKRDITIPKQKAWVNAKHWAAFVVHGA